MKCLYLTSQMALTRLFCLTVLVAASVASSMNTRMLRSGEGYPAYPAPFDPQLNSFYEVEPIRVNARLVTKILSHEAQISAF